MSLKRYRLFKEKVKLLLFEGISPQKAAMAVTLGLVLGTMPILGLSTVLLALLAIIFRLNILLIQLSNYLIYPLQLILYLPFLKTGSLLAGRSGYEPVYYKIWSILQSAGHLELGEIFYLHLWALISWISLGLPVFVSLYYVILNVLKSRIKGVRLSTSGS
ncbi:MAG: DUF2062 domain-containing protein [Bacteroidota bacterium]|nr:MAG: DUF2062 domain-containing protein [Bacteroidota bacterium]